MHIQSVRVFNYKSFVDTGDIQFEPGINLIVGENNSGKTALLEVLGGAWTNKPHVGRDHTPQAHGSARVTLRLSKDEVLELTRSNNGKLVLPTFQNAAGAVDSLFQGAINSHLDVIVRFDTNASQPTIIFPINNTEYAPVSNGATVYKLALDSPDISAWSMGIEQGGIENAFTPLATDFTQRIFFFEHGRINVHTHSLSASSPRLSRTAENLPVVIQHQHNRFSARFREEYMSLVTRVLPQIRSVTPDIIDEDGTKVTLRISYASESAMETPINHLLRESGIGVGQVLAIIYIIVYERPTAIVIDEPNAFLHPAATRELLRVFKENPQHQYFISTHSPEVFNEIRPLRYTRLVYSDGKSQPSALGFGDLGATMSDLGISPFYPKTLWVEGQSDVQAFRWIIPGSDMRFLPLLYAEDAAAEKKHQLDRVLQTYNKIEQSLNGELIPTVMRVLVDGEHFEGTERADFERQGVGFLQRKMLENYLLDVDAIAAVLNDLHGIVAPNAAVAAKLTASQADLAENDWLLEVHGVRLLESIFNDYLITYQKTTHTVALAKWIANHKPDLLTGVRQAVNTLFEKLPEPVQV